MDISFVILTWNSERFIEECISSIVDSLSGGPYLAEILVVDNGSTDSTVALLEDLKRRYPSLLFLFYLQSNRGTTVSRNIALSKCRGDFVCVMDSDVKVTAEVFAVLLRVLAEGENVSIAVPRIVYPSGKWQKSYDRFPTVTNKVHRFFRLRAIERKEAATVRVSGAPVDIDYAISAFWLFRRSLLGTVGFLDEKIFYAPEDVDYCLRVRKAGGRILYVPGVAVIHHTQEISRGWKVNKSKISHLKGLIYLFLKHRYFLRQPCFETK